MVSARIISSTDTGSNSSYKLSSVSGAILAREFKEMNWSGGNM